MTEREIIHELETRWIEKPELQQMLGGVPERVARAWVEDLNTKLADENRCVLSTSARKGYHIPSPYCDEDVAVANACLNELKNKAISIFERRKAIENFTKYSQSVAVSKGVEQLSLF